MPNQGIQSSLLHNIVQIEVFYAHFQIHSCALSLGILTQENSKVVPERLSVMMIFEMSHFVQDYAIRITFRHQENLRRKLNPSIMKTST